MDFLDPRKTRAQQIRLMVGYGLMALLIGLATVVLVYYAYGYSINTKTGDVVENGLLFVDSKPGGASISLNGKSQNSNTSARLVLLAGKYTLTLKKSGYHDWQRSFSLDAHSIARYTYPFLFPTKPVTATLKTYPALPELITQSPDRHWTLVQAPAADPAATSFDEYDGGNLSQASQTIALPAGLLTNPQLPGSTLSEVEWSTDNNHLLLKHTYQGGDEFIIVDRQNPADSINVNKLFSVAPTQVALRNKKTDQLYIYQQAAQTLQVGTTSSGALGTPILQKVLAFKSFGSNLLTYVTDSGSATSQATARIWDNGKTYTLATLSAGSTYLLDAAQFQGHWYYVAGSNASDRINLYKDPLDQLRNPSTAKSTPILNLRQADGQKVSFSDNNRFVAVESGQNFVVYDLETQQYYHYSITAPLAAPAEWMDGHRFIDSSAGQILVWDYDSTNQQLLLPTLMGKGGLFDRNFNHLLTFAPGPDSSSVLLESIDMRAGADLPKNTFQN